MGAEPRGVTNSDARRATAHPAVAVLLTVVTAFGCPLGVFAQEPPDTVAVSDSLVADSLLIDSLLSVDSLAADSVPADTIYYNMPQPTGRSPSGFATGIWSWDRRSIMSSGANTLAELFQDVPGVIGLLGGDYGTPAAVSSFGQGGAGYRVFRDGFELYPLDGGVADLQRVPLVGISEVRLERSMGQMRIEMLSYQYVEGRPFSIIEAGTGDLDTNMFRGIYADPTALGGSIGVGLERVDTRGRSPDRSEGGNRTGSWARYQFHVGDRLGLGLEYRRNQTQTRVTDYVPTTTRTDLVASASWRVADGLVIRGLAGRSSLAVDEVDEVSALGGTRGQLGATVSADVRGLWAEVTARRFEGALPSRNYEARGGFRHAELGGIAGHVERVSWPGRTTTASSARAWFTPTLHTTLFAEVSDGDYGARDAAVADGFEPPFAAPEGLVPGVAAFTNRRTSRFGAAFALAGFELAGARLDARSELDLPLGTELDAGSDAVTGALRTGYEGSVILPTRWRALTIQGSYQWWDEGGPYLPDEIYRGSFEYHKVFKETGNLELWGSLGVRGHDPMTTFVPTDGGESTTEVRFYQNWYAHVQVRVVTVRLWIGIENASLRRFNQTYPDRLLPLTRTFFALRWDLWN